MRLLQVRVGVGVGVGVWESVSVSVSVNVSLCECKCECKCESPLTRLLQHSMGRHGHTVLCVNCKTASDNYKETLSSLRWVAV